MGCHFLCQYTVKIRDGEVDGLRAAIEERRMGEWFSLDGVKLIFNCNSSMPYRFREVVEDFSRSVVSPVAAESVVAEYSTEGGVGHFRIGPDAALTRVWEFRSLDKTEDYLDTREFPDDVDSGEVRKALLDWLRDDYRESGRWYSPVHTIHAMAEEIVGENGDGPIIRRTVEAEFDVEDDD